LKLQAGTTGIQNEYIHWQDFLAEESSCKR